MRRVVRHHLPLLLVLAAACAAPGDGGEWTGTVEDSAGVAIVRNPDRGIWTDATAWRVSEELRIGVAEGDPNLQFGQIVGLDVGSDGSIYVLDQLGQRVQVFDAQGTYLRTIGRPGSGPGELSPATLAVFLTAGDTVLVPDIMQQRATRYTPDGTPVGQVALQMLEGMPVRWMHGPDGSIVEQTRVIPVPGATAAADSSSGVIRRRDMAGSVRDTMLTLPPSESFTMRGNTPNFRLFSSEPLWAVLTDGRLAVAMNDRYRIELHDADGALRRVIVRQVEASPVRDADKEQLRDRMREVMAQSGAPPQAIQMVVANMEFAPNFPVLSELQAGPDGTLLVQRVTTVDKMNLSGSGAAAFEMGAPEWDVFDREGRLLGVLTLPERFRPLRIVGDEIYGVIRDELDVQQVMKLRIQRPSAGD